MANYDKDEGIAFSSFIIFIGFKKSIFKDTVVAVLLSKFRLLDYHVRKI